MSESELEWRDPFEMTEEEIIAELRNCHQHNNQAEKSIRERKARAYVLHEEMQRRSALDRERKATKDGWKILKCRPEYFEAVRSGKKTFEIRKNDRDFRVGDTLLLQEWDPDTETYTNRSIAVKVTYVLKGDEGIAHMGLEEGYALLGIRWA